MDTLTVTSLKGAKVEITAGDIWGFDMSVNGKRHSTGTSVDFVDDDRAVGWHITAAGKAKVLVADSEKARVKAWFAARKIDQAAAQKIANAAAAKTHYVDNLMADMESRWSRN